MPAAFGFIAGATGIGAGTAIGSTAAFAAGASFAATAVGGFVVNTVVAVGLSALSQSLAPKPPTPPPSQQMVNYAQPVSYAEWVFGETRKGGPIGFTNKVNLRRYYVPILAAHPIDGIVEHWLGERVVTLNDEADQDVSNIETAPIAGYGRINVFTGEAGQVVDPGLEAAFDEITSAHDFAGLAGAVLWAKQAPQSKGVEVYPNGREWAYAPVIRGNNQIYDPRDGSTGYTNNAALVIAYWIVNILGRAVDWDEVSVAADVCDEWVTNAEGEQQRRWTINGKISDEQDFEEQRAQLAAACDAFIYERTDGKVGFIVGGWVEPTVTLTAADFFSFEVTTGNWGEAAPDEISVTYTEPENGWRETPSGTWVVKDVPKPTKHEPQFFTINNHSQAVRVARRIAKTKHAEFKLKGTLGAMGYELLGGGPNGSAHRFVRVVYPEMGIDGYFEVGKLTREGSALFTLQANSVEPSDFDFDAATEEPKRPKYGKVASDNGVPEVTGLTSSTVDGGALDFAWDEQDDSLTQQIRLRKIGEADWQTYTAQEGDSHLQVTGLPDDGDYEYQARNRTAALRPGAWKPDDPLSVGVVTSSTPPAAHSAFTAQLNGTAADLTFTTPNDELYRGTRILRATDTADIAQAQEAHVHYGAPSSTVLWSESPVAGTYHYWVEPFNYSKVPGPVSGPETVVVPNEEP